MVTLDLIYGVMTNFYGCDFRKERSRSPEIADKKAMFAMVARCYWFRHREIQVYMGWSNPSCSVLAEKKMRGFFEIYREVQLEFEEIILQVDKAAGQTYLEFDSAV